MPLDVLPITQVREAPDPGSEFLKLLQDPFSSQLQQTSIWVALGSSLGISAAIAIGFSLVRPYNTVVYAPKLKHADEKHAPPPLGKGYLAWVQPLWRTTEQEMVTLVGLDATIFMRFTRMCRNVFLLLTILGCGVMIPINYSTSVMKEATWLNKFTPANVWGGVHWVTVIVAWLFNLVTCLLLWWNYRRVLRLRRQYFASEDYQHSLHARTLMLYDIPKKFSSDEGIARIIDGVVPNSSFSRTAIARDVKILPQLIEEHAEAVKKLESVLSKYLKKPNNLPPVRPRCNPSKKDPSFLSYPKGQKVDSIDYLTQRIRLLELEIKEVRQSVDKRGSMPYGFSSYADISEAHSIAYICRRRKPEGATVTLAPRPTEIIWDNMPLSSGSRSRRRLWINFWIAILTLLWVAPNALIAIFLVNLNNLGHVWPAFQTSLSASPGIWAIVQGIASPAITSLIFLLLPIVFRRLSTRAGDQTKTGRERHVTAKLYSFFVFNNLFVFSMFSAVWSFTAGVVKTANTGVNAWKAFLDEDLASTVFVTLCSISPFFVTWLLQRQLGVAIDLAQLWTLLYSSVMRKFSSPTPRELIELTAPPPLDYASYLNNFMYYATVTLAYAFIQPLVLPAAALYFVIDVALRKYLILYIFVTKNESGGMYWRVMFNRFLFGMFVCNLVVFLIVWVRGIGTHTQAYAVAPLPLLLLAFKFYCARAFDDKIHFFSTKLIRHDAAEGGVNVKEQSLRNDRLAARFGHPALYKPLITPMVHAKAQNVLPSVYQGRLSDGREALSGDTTSVSGYSDTYVMDNMASGKAGKRSGGVPGFEIVPENRLDFEYYKNRDEFAAGHGGGDIFGRDADINWPGTAGTGSESGSRPSTPVGGMGFSGRRRNLTPMAPDAGLGSPYYPPGNSSPRQYAAYPAASAFSSPILAPADNMARTRSPLYSQGNESSSNLMHGAAAMPMSPPTVPDMSYPGDMGGDGAGGRDLSALKISRAPGMFGGGPRGYGGLPQEDDFSEPLSNDYLRGSRKRDDIHGSGSGSPWEGS